MSTLLIFLRTVSLLAFAGPMLLVGVSRRPAGPRVGRVGCGQLAPPLSRRPTSDGATRAGR
jgi:hypothetical protein